MALAAPYSRRGCRDRAGSSLSSVWGRRTSWVRQSSGLARVVEAVNRAFKLADCHSPLVERNRLLGEQQDCHGHPDEGSDTSGTGPGVQRDRDQSLVAPVRLSVLGCLLLERDLELCSATPDDRHGADQLRSGRDAEGAVTPSCVVVEDGC